MTRPVDHHINSCIINHLFKEKKWYLSKLQWKERGGKQRSPKLSRVKSTVELSRVLIKYSSMMQAYFCPKKSKIYFQPFNSLCRKYLIYIFYNIYYSHTNSCQPPWNKQEHCVFYCVRLGRSILHFWTVLGQWGKKLMCKWVNMWVSECVSEWICEWVNVWVSECVSDWMCEWVNVWVSECVSECVCEWVYVWVNVWLAASTHFPSLTEGTPSLSTVGQLSYHHFQSPASL